MSQSLHLLGGAIKAQREKLGLSQEKLAQRCGFDRTYISMLERGKRNPSLLNLLKLADAISRLLLQKAYIDDPFVPEYLIHKTKKAPSWSATEVAIYSIDELVALSRSYQGFTTKPYTIRKGSYKDPPGVSHLAPRFGIIQMQRGGQAQHPEQLQFNLEAGYFYKMG